MTVPLANPTLQPGDIFTIEGCGRGAKGQTVVGGINPATRRKCKAVELTVFKVLAGPRLKRLRPGIIP